MMKRLILIANLVVLLFILMPFSTKAINTCILSGSGAEYYCASCPDLAADADLICEDFEGPGTDCTWTGGTVSTGNSWTDNYATSYDWVCNVVDSYSLRVSILDNGDGEDAWDQHDYGTEKTTVKGRFYFVVDEEDLVSASNDQVMFFAIGNADSDRRFVLQVRDRSTSPTGLKIRTQYYDSTNNMEECAYYPAGDATSISVDTPIEIEFSIVHGQLPVVNIDGTNVCSGETDNANVSWDRVTLGAQDGGTVITDSATYTRYEINNFKLDTATLASDCPGW